MSLVTMGVDTEGRIAIASYPERVKVLNARRDPEASISIMSDEFNGDWVQVDGTIEVLYLPEALDGLVDYFRVISGEHSDWDEYRQAMTDQGKVLLHLTPQRWGPISCGGFPAHLVD